MEVAEETLVSVHEQLDQLGREVVQPDSLPVGHSSYCFLSLEQGSYVVERHERGSLFDLVGHWRVDGERLGVEELTGMPLPPPAD